MQFLQYSGYRNDIEGLRAIAVIAVVLFHFGILKNGHLGVDIFFVISGYLITKILLLEIREQRFSLKQFYIRRIRRIIPLVLFFCFLCQVIGAIVMLPDDFENLSQSIFASLLFSNNLLLYITIGDYYSIANEYKPLMHTWSLGIEEQFYLFWPFLFIFFKNKIKLLTPVTIILLICSFLLYCSNFSNELKFFLLPFRFFELAIGGLAAIFLVNKLYVFNLRFSLIAGLLLILSFDFLPNSDFLSIPTVCLLTVLLLITSEKRFFVSNFFLENRLMVTIGKISFSIYMWHQVILAFTRYVFIHELSGFTLVILFISTIALSFFTYYFVESPFRNKEKIKVSNLLSSTCFISLFLIISSWAIYQKAGVIRDVPLLNISKSEYKSDQNVDYTRRFTNLPKLFTQSKKKKVLVFGDSFSNDWSNVLMESKFKESIELVSVKSWLISEKELNELKSQSDIIFFAMITNKKNRHLAELKNEKFWYIGVKNFGINNGPFYNYIGEEFCKQRTHLSKNYLSENSEKKKIWGEKYIDIIGQLSNEYGTVPIFTPDCKFISHDTRHLTQPGAKYIGDLLENQLEKIFGSNIEPKQLKKIK